MASNYNIPAANLQQEVGAAEFCQKYQINPSFESKLAQLQNYKIVVIADDSGSMKSKSDAHIEGVASRWDELKLMCKLLVELYSVFNKDGVDLHFLNRSPIFGLTSVDDARFVKSFQEAPSGPTPICNTLQRVLDDEIAKQRIIIIATDGCPTSMDGRTSEIGRLKQILVDRNATANHVAIVACTGDHDTLSYLNRWDIEIVNLDVVDDYVSERAEVWRAQGTQFRFGYADYVIKLALSSVDSYFDRLDEMTPQMAAAQQKSDTACCNIM